MTLKPSRPQEAGAPSEPQKWAWLLGFAGLGCGNWAAEYADASRAWAVLGAFLAIGAGWAWQRIYRRDLAARLELLSWLFVAAVVVWGVLAFVPGVDEEDRGFGPGDLTGLCGVVTGLVLSELHLRKADRGA